MEDKKKELRRVSLHRPLLKVVWKGESLLSFRVPVHLRSYSPSTCSSTDRIQNVLIKRTLIIRILHMKSFTDKDRGRKKKPTVWTKIETLKSCDPLKL